MTKTRSPETPSFLTAVRRIEALTQEIQKDGLAAFEKAASIDPSRRGETLSIDDFVRLLQRAADRPDDTAAPNPGAAPSTAPTG